jgi:hypothetical protein
MTNDSCERSEPEFMVKLIGKLYHFFGYVIKVSRGTITGGQPLKRFIINGKTRTKNRETFIENIKLGSNIKSDYLWAFLLIKSFYGGIESVIQ